MEQNVLGKARSATLLKFIFRRQGKSLQKSLSSTKVI